MPFVLMERTYTLRFKFKATASTVLVFLKTARPALSKANTHLPSPVKLINQWGWASTILSISIQLTKLSVSAPAGALPGILGPMKRNLIGPLHRPVKTFDAILYKTMHFSDIFDNSHICEKNNMTVTWLLLTVSFVVLHAGLIYLRNCRL